jgi:TolA-binding protein
MIRLKPWGISLGLLTFASPAWALSCDEIMNMVDVNVPTNIVVQTMESSGTRFSAEDIKCLDQRGAPSEVVDVARKMAATDEPETTEEAPKPSSSGSKSGSAGAKSGSQFEESEELGGEDNSLPEEGAGDEGGEDAGGGPKQVEELIKMYRAKKLLGASLGFFELLEDNTFPDEESKISYYLAKSLYDLGMYHGAQHYFMQVVRKGPKNPYFKYALPKLVAIAQLTGNDTELLRIVDKIPPEAFPRQAKNYLYYLMGRKHYENEELSQAAKYFQQISAKSDLYLKAKYYEGVIRNEQDKLKSAVTAFKDVYQAELPPLDDRQAKEYEDLKDLSLMNIARIYYGLQRFDNADNFYGQVDRDSIYWPESLFERAWTNFMLNDLNLTLGLLLTVRSPYFADEQFIPEATVLRALSFFYLCDFNEVERILLDFDAQHKPMRAEIKAFLDQYKTEEGAKLADQAYDAYFDQKHAESALTKSLFLKTLRNRDLADLVRHIQMLDDEEAMIDAQKSQWKDAIGAHLKKVIEEDRQRYKKRAGAILLEELAQEYKNLGDLMGQSEIIRFEVVDAQRADYEYKASTIEVESAAEKKVDFATSKEIIYWPFNGEFWQDELGYYRYTEESQCRYR